MLLLLLLLLLLFIIIIYYYLTSKGIGNPSSKRSPGKMRSYDSLRAKRYFQTLHHRVRKIVVCGGPRTPANSTTTSKRYVMEIKCILLQEKNISKI